MPSTNLERRRETWRLYYQRNKERVDVARKAQYAANVEKKLEYARKYREANKDKLKAAQAKWYGNNRERRYDLNARRRARARQATVRWADRKEIQKIYKQARELSKQTGLKHHVDHIVPLKGTNVCGFHVHYNLRVILATDNLSKRNKLEELNL